MGVTVAQTRSPGYGRDPSFFTHPRRACHPRPDGGLAIPFDPWFAYTIREQLPARELCRRCPVMDACAAWAITHPNLMGIWGDTSDHERKLLRRRMALSPV